MRRILATLAVVGALLFSAGSAWAEVPSWAVGMDEALEEISEAITAYESGDYTTALQQALPFATGGNPLAQAMVGNFFGDGLGVEKE